MVENIGREAIAHIMPPFLSPWLLGMLREGRPGCHERYTEREVPIGEALEFLRQLSADDPTGDGLFRMKASA